MNKRWIYRNMEQGVFHYRYVLVVAATAVVLGSASVAAFAGWMAYGTDIILTYAETGLSWCL